MPFYEILCSGCNHRWEVKGSMSNPPKTRKCPKCGKKGYRQILPTAVHFKGTGFYETDYKRKS